MPPINTPIKIYGSKIFNTSISACCAYAESIPRAVSSADPIAKPLPIAAARPDQSLDADPRSDHCVAVRCRSGSAFRRTQRLSAPGHSIPA